MGNRLQDAAGRAGEGGDDWAREVHKAVEGPTGFGGRARRFIKMLRTILVALLAVGLSTACSKKEDKNPAKAEEKDPAAKTPAAANPAPAAAADPTSAEEEVNEDDEGGDDAMGDEDVGDEDVGDEDTATGEGDGLEEEAE